jgi:predicted ATPase
MITRLYVNNYRCLVNFNAEFDSFAVLCGPNGAGKSSVFDALRLLRNLGTGDAVLGGSGQHDVPTLDFTGWLDSHIQEFEFGFGVDGHQFKYLLHVEQKAEFEKPRIIKEQANCDGKLLYKRDLQGVEFEKARGEKRFFRSIGDRRRLRPFNRTA